MSMYMSHCEGCHQTREQVLKGDWGYIWDQEFCNPGVRYEVWWTYCDCGKGTQVVSAFEGLAKALQKDKGRLTSDEIYGVADRIGVDRNDLAWALNAVGTPVDTKGLEQPPTINLDLTLRTLLVAQGAKEGRWLRGEVASTK